MKNTKLPIKIMMTAILYLSVTGLGYAEVKNETVEQNDKVKTVKEEIKKVDNNSKDEAVEEKSNVISKTDSENILSTTETVSPSIAKTKSDLEKQQSLGSQTHDLLRSMASLILLMLLLFVGSWFLKKKFSLKPNSKNIIGLVSVMNMGNKEKIALLKVGSQNILIGITQQNIRTLYTYPAEEEVKNSTKVSQQEQVEASKEFSFIMDRATSKDEPEQKGKENG